VTAQDPHTTLLGADADEYTTIIQWLSFANSELMPALGHWLRPLLGADPYDPVTNVRAKDEALHVVELLEERLAGREWLVGAGPGRVSIADVFTASMLSHGLQFVLGREWREAHPITIAWFEQVVGMEWVREVANVKMCEKVAVWSGERRVLNGDVSMAR